MNPSISSLPGPPEGCSPQPVAPEHPRAGSSLGSQRKEGINPGPSGPLGHKGRGRSGDLCLLEWQSPPLPEPEWEKRGLALGVLLPTAHISTGPELPRSCNCRVRGLVSTRRGVPLWATADEWEEQARAPRNLPSGLCPPGDPPPRPAVGRTCSMCVFLGPQTVLHGAPPPQKAPGGPPSLPRLSLRSDGAAAPARACCRRVLTYPLPPPGYALRRLLVPPGLMRRLSPLRPGCVGLDKSLFLCSGPRYSWLPEPPRPLCLRPRLRPSPASPPQPCLRWSEHTCLQSGPRCAHRGFQKERVRLRLSWTPRPEQPSPAFHLPLLTLGTTTQPPLA